MDLKQCIYCLCNKINDLGNIMKFQRINTAENNIPKLKLLLKKESTLKNQFLTKNKYLLLSTILLCTIVSYRDCHEKNDTDREIYY